MKKAVCIFFLVFITFACNLNRSQNDAEIVVFCAASLTDVISEIAAEFEKANDIEVKLNLASSGTLARQIEHGATPSVYISANKSWLDYLDEQELTIPGTAKKVAGNSMVLIVPDESSLEQIPFSSGMNFPDLFEGRLSVGDPNHVPAGAYAAQILRNLGFWDEMEQRLLPAKDVRSALMVVELGEVDAGIVYKTDALKSEKVRIITEFPDSLHDPVDYYMTEIKGQESEISENLFNFINSEQALPIWEKYGFTH